MFKKWLIEKGIKILVCLIALGVGIWYLSSSIGGASLSYTSVDTFLQQIGSARTNDTGIPGCFLCKYIDDLFIVIGNSTESFWTGIVRNLWIVMAIGFGIFLVLHTLKHLHEHANSKDVKDLTNAEPKFDFKKWFEKVWKTGVRVMIVGALIGALNWSGTGALRAVTHMTVTPVMYLGSILSQAATGVISGTQCKPVADIQDENIIKPVSEPFMCVIGNLNTVMLAGAGGGFALMNYAWMDLDGDGGGVFTWLAGLALVIGFLVIGFNLLFQVLTVVFKLVFIIIFMPLLLAASAFEQVWGLAKKVMNTAIDILVNSVVSILKISIKVCIIYAIVYFSASQYGFTTIMPPLLGEFENESSTEQSIAVVNAFSTCERVALVDDKMDRDKFKKCFIEQREIVKSQYPHAFDFMDNGFGFLLYMIGIIFLYFWVVSPEVDKLLSKDGKETFDYGQWLKDFGTTTYNAPGKIYTKVKEVIDKGK